MDHPTWTVLADSLYDHIVRKIKKNYRRIWKKPSTLRPDNQILQLIKEIRFPDVIIAYNL